MLDKFGPNPIAIDVVENLHLNFIISTDPLSLGRLQAFDSPHIILDWHLEGKSFVTPTTMGEGAKEGKTRAMTYEH